VSEQWGQQPQDQPEPGPTQPAFPQYPQQQYPAAPPLGGGFGGGVPGYGAPGQPYGPPRNSKLAIASLILGIISLPMVLIPVVGPIVALIGLVLGIVGIVGASRRNLKRGIGIAGIVLSVLGLIGGGLITVAEVHAINACKSIDKNDTTAYNDCIKKNLKL
jgi:hypothetical protein